MTGLDKILAQIQADTDSTCAGIKKNADTKCADIVNDAHKQAEIIKNTGSVNAQRTREEIIKRANSAAELKRRSVILNAKQEIVSSSLKSAQKYLCDLPDNEYFNLICRMIEKYSESLDGEIFFSQKDLSRISEVHKENIKNSAKGKLIFSAEPVNITGGFILKYGGIEVNCAFESIFSSNHEKFSDAISHMLFK